jgi:hypothetical protein
MVTVIKVQTMEEFEQMLLEKDFRISEAIVNKALENLHSKKRFIPVLEVEIIDEGQVFDITLNRDNMVETLKQNLEIFEFNEQYEGCVKILNAIKELEKNIN